MDDLHVAVVDDSRMSSEHLPKGVHSPDALEGPLAVPWEGDSLLNHGMTMEPNVMRREAISSKVIDDEINGLKANQFP